MDDIEDIYDIHSSRRPSGTTNVATASSINSLPPELLIKIFSFHILHNYRNPTSLIFICRMWSSIVLSTGTLWTRIMYGKINVNALATDVCEDLEGSLHCKDPISLARAIQKSGEAKFTLAIGHVPSKADAEKEWGALKVLDQAWFRTRCRSLRLLEDEVPPHLSTMFEDLSALEELVCSRLLLTWNPQHDRILDIANRTSRNLVCLSYRGYLDIRKYESLLRRLRVLELPSHPVRGIVQFAMDHLENVEEVALVGNQFRDIDPCHYDLPPSLRRFAISHEDLSARPSDFTNLTHLTLRSCSINNGTMVSCPALTDLTFLYPGECMIDAPNLRRLTVLGRILLPEPSLIWAHLQPISLQIDVICLENSEVGDLRATCSQVQECTIICNVPGMIALERAKVLFDDASGMSSCPSLRYLNFICPFIEDISNSEQQRFKDELAEFADALRRSTAFSCLERVKCGRYNVLKRHTVEHAWKRWWDIEWSMIE